MSPAALTILPGQVFGRCTVLRSDLFQWESRRSRGKSQRRRVCLVRCVCGTECLVPLNHLRSGATKSCGCLSRETSQLLHQTHGASKTPLYRVWCAFRRRCRSPRDKNYPQYGGRGIRVCDAWNSAFEPFREWAMAHGYAPGMTIDRIDVNGHYTPENCRFIQFLEQGENRRQTVWITYAGETKSIRGWSQDPRCVVKEKTLSSRLRAGWLPEKALTVPPDLANHRLHLSRPPGQG